MTSASNCNGGSIETGLHQGRPILVFAKPVACSRERHVVLVDAKEGKRIICFQDSFSVPCSPEGEIREDSSWQASGVACNLPDHDGNVIKIVWRCHEKGQQKVEVLRGGGLMVEP